MSSDLASLAPMSSSTSSLGALEADPTDPLGISGLGLGPAPVLAARLDALAGELSAASTLPGTTPRGTAHGGRATGTPGMRPELSERQQQLGDLAQISSALATQLGLEIEGLGLAGRAAAGGMASVGSSSLYSPAGGPGAGGLGAFGTVAAMERAGSLGRQQSSQMPPPPSMPPAPSMRVWAQAGSTSHGSGSTAAGSRPGPGAGGGGGGGVAMRSTDVSPLLGSANVEALAGVTLPVQVSARGKRVSGRPVVYGVVGTTYHGHGTVRAHPIGLHHGNPCRDATVAVGVRPFFRYPRWWDGASTLPCTRAGFRSGNSPSTPLPRSCPRHLRRCPAWAGPAPQVRALPARHVETPMRELVARGSRAACTHRTLRAACRPSPLYTPSAIAMTMACNAHLYSGAWGIT